MNDKKLPLRIGVGAIVLNYENKVFVGKRKDNPIDKWQMPQGGINKNEDFLSAMKRELEEETSIKNIKVLKELKKILNTNYLKSFWALFGKANLGDKNKMVYSKIYW